RPGRQLLHAGKELHPVHPGHLEVRDHDQGLEGGEQLQAARPILGRLDLPLTSPQDTPQRPEDVLLVVDQQQPPGESAGWTRCWCHLNGYHDGGKRKEPALLLCKAAASLVGKLTAWNSAF